MKDGTKKVIKYGIIGAIFAAVGLFIYGVWKRVKKSNTDTTASSESDTINMSPGENGVYNAETPESNSKKIKIASIDEFRDWTNKLKKATDKDWFTRLVNLDFKQKK